MLRDDTAARLRRRNTTTRGLSSFLVPSLSWLATPDDEALYLQSGGRDDSRCNPKRDHRGKSTWTGIRIDYDSILPANYNRQDVFIATAFHSCPAVAFGRRSKALSTIGAAARGRNALLAATRCGTACDVSDVRFSCRSMR